MDVIVIENIKDMKDRTYYIEVLNKKQKRLGLGLYYKENPKGYDFSKSKFVEIPDNIDILELAEEIF